MNTTSKLFASGIALTLTVLPAVGWASPTAGTVGLLLGAASMGDDSSNDLQQVDELLRQARKAIADGKYEVADSCITRAEKLNPKYSIFHMGDTPAKARKDLNSTLVRKTGMKGLSTTPDKDSAAAKDPFLAHADSARSDSSPGTSGRPDAAHANSSPAQLPTVDANAGAPARPWNVPSAAPAYPSTGMAAINVGEADAKIQSEKLLLGARRALAVGDARRAATLVEQAKGFQVNYGPMEDSPAKVEALIKKQAELTSDSANRDSEVYRHQSAELLMEQAQGLLRFREFDEAERLATEAQQLPVQYNPVETRPDVLLQRIAEERRHNGINAPATIAQSPDLHAINDQGPSAGQGWPAAGNKQQAVELVRQARAALAHNDLTQAEQLARQADGMALDSAYGPQEDRPSLVLFEIQKARLRGNSEVILAGGTIPANGNGNFAARSIYDSSNDPTRNVQTTAAESPFAQRPENLLAADDSHPAGNAPTSAVQAYQMGEKALLEGNSEQALKLFQEAYAGKDQLDPDAQRRLQDRLMMLSSQGRSAPSGSLLEGAAARQQVQVRQLASEVARMENAAQAMQEKQPKAAMEVLKKARALVDTAPAELNPQDRQQLQRNIDGHIQELQQFIQKNFAQIELDEKNAQVKADVEHRQQTTIQISEKFATMVDEYHKLIEDRRYDEAELVAKQALEMMPENPVAVQMAFMSKMIHREAIGRQNKENEEQGVVDALTAVDKAAIPFTKDIEFTDRPSWEKLTRSRKALLSDDRSHRLPGEMEIEKKLTTPVSLKFKQAPLGDVLHYLANVTQVNLDIDPQGLQAEGVTTDQPVTIDLTSDIQLKSALDLILEPLHLNYVIKDEVLKITSEDKKHGQLITKSYPVADLVIPIPNFAPDGREGINAALREGYSRLGYSGGGGSGGFGGAPLAVVASDTGAKTSAMVNPAVLAQMHSLGTGPTSGTPQPTNFGPGGLKGGSQADFDSLIDLITSTIQPQSWDQTGGPGSIAPFETNLTLVVSQTQEVHEEIADLLQQLRRLQDLQVTIEVRFITLNDQFFEQMGVNFNVNVPGGTSPINVAADGSVHTVTSPSTVVGVSQGTGPTAISAFKDIQFQQSTFTNAAVPVLSGLTVDSNPTSFGFAILSDIEAYFVIQAFEGDTRTNVLQAPKVTLFNGQQAFVSDTSQRPFVTSVVPVVGDFAAAQQPVITVLSEGTSLTVQAVVSPDRRFVRLTVVPFFSQIGDVSTFTFTGSTTTTTNSSDSQSGSGVNTASSAGDTTTTAGTTVQLPTFNFVTVTTTVSVPDGGTVLLGGIKRLSEGRNERGVPILSKIPYINRLFRDVAIGRATSSLMMMVTPRIIIQEEEEANLLGTSTQ